MGCFGFGSSKNQTDDRFNLHDPPARSVPTPGTKVANSTSSNVKPAGLARSSSRGGNSALIRKLPIVTDPLFASDIDVRPSGLFADVKPPLLAQQHRPPRSKRSQGDISTRSDRTPKLGTLDSIEDGPTRIRSPVSEKANKILGRDPDPIIRYNQKLSEMKQISKDESSHSSTTVSPTSSLLKEATQNQRKARAGSRPEMRKRRPRPVELPANYPDSIEKQVAISHDHVLNRAQSYSTLGYETDSAVELPTESYLTTGPSSPSTIAELQGSEICTPAPAVELPGSDPFIAYEVDAGPLPPCELPGSFSFLEHKGVQILHPPLRKAHVLTQQRPVQYAQYGHGFV